MNDFTIKAAGVAAPAYDLSLFDKVSPSELQAAIEDARMWAVLHGKPQTVIQCRRFDAYGDLPAQPCRVARNSGGPRALECIEIGAHRALATVDVSGMLTYARQAVGA